MPSDHEIEKAEDRQPIAALLGQLADDTKAFAKAEIDYLKAEAGERVDHAIPGVAMVGVAAALGMGALIALLVGLIMILTNSVGLPFAVLIVCGVSFIITWLLWRSGAGRLKHAFKSRDR